MKTTDPLKPYSYNKQELIKALSYKLFKESHVSDVGYIQGGSITISVLNKLTKKDLRFLYYMKSGHPPEFVDISQEIKEFEKTCKEIDKWIKSK